MMNVIERIEKYKKSNSIRKRESAEFEMKGLQIFFKEYDAEIYALREGIARQLLNAKSPEAKEAFLDIMEWVNRLNNEIDKDPLLPLKIKKYVEKGEIEL